VNTDADAVGGGATGAGGGVTFGAGEGATGGGAGGGGLFFAEEIVFVLSEIAIFSLSLCPRAGNGVNTGADAADGGATGAGGGVAFGAGEGATGGGLSRVKENMFVLSEIAIFSLSLRRLTGNGVNTGGGLVATGSNEGGFVSKLISGTTGAGEKCGCAGIACGAAAATVSTF
jgi:hypothetical protein